MKTSVLILFLSGLIGCGDIAESLCEDGFEEAQQENGYAILSYNGGYKDFVVKSTTNDISEVESFAIDFTVGDYVVTILEDGLDNSGFEGTIAFYEGEQNFNDGIAFFEQSRDGAAVVSSLTVPYEVTIFMSISGKTSDLASCHTYNLVLEEE